MSNILEKYCKVLQTVKNPSLDSVGHVGKNGSRAYKYASLKACEEVVREACKAQDISFAYGIDCSDDGIWYVRTLISDGKEKLWANPVPIKIDGTAQDIGSWITYARRYSLCATFAIVGEEDDDARSLSSQQRPAKRQGPRQDKSVDVERNKAIQRLNGILQAYSNAHAGVTFEALKEGLKKRPDFSDTADFYRRAAAEFEKDIDAKPVA